MCRPIFSTPSTPKLTHKLHPSLCIQHSMTCFQVSARLEEVFPPEGQRHPLSGQNVGRTETRAEFSIVTKGGDIELRPGDAAPERKFLDLCAIFKGGKVSALFLLSYRCLEKALNARFTLSTAFLKKPFEAGTARKSQLRC